METSCVKKPRAANFTDPELCCLLREVETHRDRLFGSRRDGVTPAAAMLKRHLWEDIAEKVTGVSVHARHWGQVRKKWGDMTIMARRYEKQVLRGEPTCTRLAPFYGIVLRILGGVRNHTSITQQALPVKSPPPSDDDSPGAASAEWICSSWEELRAATHSGVAMETPGRLLSLDSSSPPQAEDSQIPPGPPPEGPTPPARPQTPPGPPPEGPASPARPQTPPGPPPEGPAPPARPQTPPRPPPEGPSSGDSLTEQYMRSKMALNRAEMRKTLLEIELLQLRKKILLKQAGDQ